MEYVFESKPSEQLVVDPVLLTLDGLNYGFTQTVPVIYDQSLRLRKHRSYSALIAGIEAMFRASFATVAN